MVKIQEIIKFVDWNDPADVALFFLLLFAVLVSLVGIVVSLIYG